MSVTHALSIIVPLYNVAIHMETLIATLSQQDAALIEVIFVNDGSSDTTVVALNVALAANPLTMPWRILEKSNGGLSDARNFGLNASQAPYVAFLDPDDELSPDFYMDLMQRLKSTDADVAVSSSIEVWPNGKQRPCIYSATVHESRDSAEWLLMYDWSACTKIFARSLFDDNRFDVGIRYEDLAILPYLMAIAGRVCTSETAIYYYHRRLGSITLEGDFDKEIKILESTDLIARRLQTIDRSDLVWPLLQKVLVTGFVPSITSRYSPSKSRRFACDVAHYLIQYRPDGISRSLRPRAILTNLFLAAPVPMRWGITGLYKLATLRAN
jgi:glycosyltransferase involved in cell wall biosynthesis